jgi:hypothetical protein
MTTLKDLVGPHKLETVARMDIRHPFDADANGIAWAMDGKVYFVFEDQGDGYRSAASPILSADGDAYMFGNWRPEYLHREVVGRLIERTGSGEAEILELADVETGHVWLRVGTDATDDYYPWFVAEWRPYKPIEAGET